MAQLLPEWAPQGSIQLCWPSQREYWGDQTEAAQATHCDIISHISQYQAVLLIHSPDCPSEAITQQLADAGAVLARITLVAQPNNDIWCRDYGPISAQADNGARELHDFVFTGWGGKFPAQQDNAASASLAQRGHYPYPLRSHQLILEGGAIDYDGNGSLLTTQACLLNPNRNANWNTADYETFFQQQLGIQQIHWLSQGYLAGDDTDSHVDMLARFAPSNDQGGVIIYQGCQDPADEHYQALNALRDELETLRDCDGQAYQLVELPFPPAHYDDGERLPASYANFLITNQEVLVPAYGGATDETARQRIARCFPNRTAVSINCTPLIHQYGSLHCATMQIAQ